ncbi:MAG TPA: hypothetical protein VHT30_13395 [Acidimicrobiales bacterium]|jgi:hypothetical protein|nr:hypothetical protein [Acidimicrobiales bacterium]
MPLTVASHFPDDVSDGRLIAAIAFVALVLTVAATVMVWITARGGPAASAAEPLTLRPVTAPSGFSPEDFGRLRIYVPPGWESIPGCKAAGDIFYLVPSAEEQDVFDGGCAPSLENWASIQPFAGTAPATWTTSTINGTAVWSQQTDGRDTLDIPSLDAQVTAVGAGRDIVTTIGPSTLDAVLRLRHAVNVPRTWHVVRFDGLQMRVPRGWPVEVLTRKVPEPGACSSQVFRTPTVYEGAGGFWPICTIGFSPLAPPVDGVWVDPPGLSLHLDMQPMPFGEYPVNVEYTNTESDAVIGLDVRIGTRRINLIVGLGRDPTVAEEILSSLT